MSYESSMNSNSSFLQDTLPLSSPDTGLYHFFNNSQSSQENKNGLGLSSLKMNSRLSINNIGFSSIKGSESQPVSKYGNTLSFSQNQSQKDINNSWPIGANNRSIKSFKDIDLIKNRVLNSSVVGSDKVIVDSVIQCIKEITSDLFDTIKSLSGEIVSLKSKIDVTQETTNAKLSELINDNRFKDDQIKQLNSQMSNMQLKINQVVSSSTKVENSLDELVFKQSQTSSIKSSNSLTNQTVLVEQTIGGILSQLNQSQAELDSKLSAKMTEKFDDLKTLIIHKKTSDGSSSSHESKFSTYKSICRKYKRLRKNKKKKNVSIRRISKIKTCDMSPSSKLAQTFNMLNISGDLKWVRIKDPVTLDNEASLHSSNTSSNQHFSVFDLSSY